MTTIQAQFHHSMRERQLVLADWMLHKIGVRENFISIPERSRRFFEEATELVQATGLTKEECLLLVEYVFARPVGNAEQEIGGVEVTLCTLAERLGYNVAVCLDNEIDRVHKPEMIERVRAAIIRKRNDGVGI